MEFEFDYDEYTINPGKRQTVFAIKISQGYNQEPLTLVLDSAVFELPVDTSFVSDPGPDPQPGQTWQLDQDIAFGEYSLRVLSAILEIDCSCYSFLISSADVYNVCLNGLEHGGGSVQEFW
jgi:hypothetical protein